MRADVQCRSLRRGPMGPSGGSPRAVLNAPARMGGPGSLERRLPRGGSPFDQTTGLWGRLVALLPSLPEEAVGWPQTSIESVPARGQAMVCTSGTLRVEQLFLGR